MTDEITQQTQPSTKEEKRPVSTGNNSNNASNIANYNRNPKRTYSTSKPQGSISNPSGTGQGGSSNSNINASVINANSAISSNNSRPLSGAGNRRGPGNSNSAAGSAAESGSESAPRKPYENGKKPDQRHSNRNQGGNGNGGNRNQQHRKGQSSASQGGRLNSNSNNRDQVQSNRTHSSNSPAPPVQQLQQPQQGNKDGADALSSLQRVIADLKSTSPAPGSAAANINNNAVPNNQFVMNAPVAHLTPNAPIFQPGAGGFQATSLLESAKHRKAASLGTSLGAPAFSGNFNSFSPHLGAMLEDPEDGGMYEEGEIAESYYGQQQQQPGHQPRSQSQSFVAPRFAALAAQQDQTIDTVGPTGRPQLAPGFMFGARKRASPMGPSINEEDLGFQFPQQQQQSGYQEERSMPAPSHRRGESAEITGIMAEQVRIISYLCLGVPFGRYMLTARFVFFVCAHRLRSRAKLKLFSSSNRPCTNINLPLVTSSPCRPPVSPPAALVIAACKAPFP